MTDDQQLPPELVSLAGEFGIDRGEIDTVHQIIKLTPEIPVQAIAANGQPLGDGIIRAAREYDHQIGAEEGYENQTMMVLVAENAGVQIAFVVDRTELAKALTVEIPDVPSTPEPPQS